MSHYVVGAIFARGGSKGVPRKNIRPLAGKPLIGHAIESALASETIDRVIVSTDDEEIAAVARDFGAEVPFMRPAELARDDSPEWEAWRHAIRWLASEGGPHLDALASIPPTAPLRSAEDVDACVRALLSGDADVVITVTPAGRNPYFNMVVLDGARARLVLEGIGAINRRQDAPPVYDITTVAYAVRPEFVLESDSMFAGGVSAVVVPAERALDIDTDLDLAVAECLLSRAANGATR